MHKPNVNAETQNINAQKLHKLKKDTRITQLYLY